MSKTSKPELLAPAGGPDQLDAAIRFGADAVYLACDRFGMRARAQNFKLEDMPQVVARCHAAGVKVHVTINILMNDDDIAAMPAFMSALDRAGVDAFIIGDLGAFSIAREHAPHVDLHVSTQASVMNAAAARQWYQLGARRIVCAREMSVDAIRRLHEQIPDDLELECFVHGAMCMAYSGRCLLSSVMTGRTANRGACAQSCRWSYALVEEQRPGEYFPVEEDVRGSYIMNAQDLNMIRHLDELASAGVDSFKIEGRNKRAFYVATVVRAYRQVLDGGDVNAAEAELNTISHRPYSTGFYFGRATQSPERDGYVKEYLHTATVMACEPANEAAGCETFGSAGQGAGGEGSAFPKNDAAGEDSPLSTEAAEVEDSASVTKPASRTAPLWHVYVRCCNRFFEGDELEVLDPGPIIKHVLAREICRLAPKDGGLPFVERGLSFEQVRNQSVLVAEPVANRASEYYRITLPCQLKPGDYLRRRIDR